MQDIAGCNLSVTGKSWRTIVVIYSFGFRHHLAPLYCHCMLIIELVCAKKMAEEAKHNTWHNLSNMSENNCCVLLCSIVMWCKGNRSIELKGNHLWFYKEFEQSHCFMADHWVCSNSLNEPYNINSALDIKIQNIVKTLLNITVTRSAV